MFGGEPGRALDQAYQAMREFNRQQRPRFAARARFVVLRSRLAGDDRSQVAVAHLERAAADLSEYGWPVMTLEARLMAGQLALERGWASRGRSGISFSQRDRRFCACRLASAWSGNGANILCTFKGTRIRTLQLTHAPLDLTNGFIIMRL